MRKRIILLGLLVSTIIFSLTGCNWSTRKFGGTMNVELPEGYKLQEATWKDDELWYLVRPMREGEYPEDWILEEKTNMGVIEGTVIFHESKKED